jgi:transposase
MKRKRSSDEQIAFALRQAESGTAVEEICRKLGVSEPTCLTVEEAVRRNGCPGDPTAQAARGREQQAEEAGGRSDA